MSGIINKYYPNDTLITGTKKSSDSPSLNRNYDSLTWLNPSGTRSHHDYVSVYNDQYIYSDFLEPIQSDVFPNRYLVQGLTFGLEDVRDTYNPVNSNVNLRLRSEYLGATAQDYIIFATLHNQYTKVYHYSGYFTSDLLGDASPFVDLTLNYAHQSGNFNSPQEVTSNKNYLTISFQTKTGDGARYPIDIAYVEYQTSGDYIDKGTVPFFCVGGSNVFKQQNVLASGLINYTIQAETIPPTIGLSGINFSSIGVGSYGYSYNLIDLPNNNGGISISNFSGNYLHADFGFNKPDLSPNFLGYMDAKNVSMLGVQVDFDLGINKAGNFSGNVMLDCRLDLLSGISAGQVGVWHAPIKKYLMVGSTFTQHVTLYGDVPQIGYLKDNPHMILSAGFDGSDVESVSSSTIGFSIENVNLTFRGYFYESGVSSSDTNLFLKAKPYTYERLAPIKDWFTEVNTKWYTSDNPVTCFCCESESLTCATTGTVSVFNRDITWTDGLNHTREGYFIENAYYNQAADDEFYVWHNGSNIIAINTLGSSPESNRIFQGTGTACNPSGQIVVGEYVLSNISGTIPPSSITVALG